MERPGSKMIETEKDFAKLQNFYVFLCSKMSKTEVSVHPVSDEQFNVIFILPGIESKFLHEVVLPVAWKLFAASNVQVMPYDVFAESLGIWKRNYTFVLHIKVSRVFFKRFADSPLGGKVMRVGKENDDD